MSDVSIILKDDRYPKWIVSHPIFKEIKKITKVFPVIGLPNYEEDFVCDNTIAANRAAKSLLRSINLKLTDKRTTLCNAVAKGKADKKFDNAIALLTKVSNSLTPTKTILKDKDKISLKLPSNIADANGKTVFKAGESLFRVYNKLNDILRSKEVSTTAMRALDTLPAFKRFSTENVPNHKFKIVFSSYGKEGLWDIATMSQRGIHSCQSWNGEYKHHLIGSMLDPFVGIIYLTSGKADSQFGSKMMRRCVVRFIISSKEKRPMIIIDNMYPSMDVAIANAFVKSIQSRIGDKFEVKLTSKILAPDSRELYSPLTDLRDKLLKYNARGGKDVYERLDSIASYQDYHVSDKKPISAIEDKAAALFEKNSSKKTAAFTSMVIRTSSETIRKIDNKLDSATLKIARTYGYIISDMAASLADDIVNTVDKSKFTNSDTYIRRVYYNYFNRKEAIILAKRAEWARFVNGRIGLGKANRLSAKQIHAVMNAMLPIVDVQVKKELQQLVEKRKFSGPLPLP